ncbi:UNVERIFIED_CONTAM: hypothetical protein K2H54_040025 [Gekko kuhli]
MLLTTILLLSAVALQADLSSGSVTSAENQKEILDKHNDFRRNVDPPASNMLKMVWNEDVAVNAKKWADQCKLTVSPNEQRIINGVQCGENVFMASYPSAWSNAIQMWYNGGSNFKLFGIIHTRPDALSLIAQSRSTLTSSSANTYLPGQQGSYRHKEEGLDVITSDVAMSLLACAGSDIIILCRYLANPCKYTDVATNCQQMEKLFGCKEKMVIDNCPASCNCKTEIK